MTNNDNNTCKLCKHSYNALNGRFCGLHHQYVEYTNIPQCTNL